MDDEPIEQVVEDVRVLFNNISDKYHNEKDELKQLFIKYIILNPDDCSNEDLDTINDFIEWVMIQDKKD